MRFRLDWRVWGIFLHLIGVVPSTLSKISGLTDLDLQGNKLTGEWTAVRAVLMNMGHFLCRKPPLCTNTRWIGKSSLLSIRDVSMSMCVVINFNKLVSFEPDSLVSRVTFACPVLCQPSHSTTRLNLVYDFIRTVMCQSMRTIYQSPTSTISLGVLSLLSSQDAFPNILAICMLSGS